MGEIIQFPSIDDSGWQIVEKSLKDLFEQTDASQAMQQHLLQRMEKAWAEFQFNESIQINVPEAYLDKITKELEQFQTKLKEHTNDLLLKRLLIEIELAHALEL